MAKKALSTVTFLGLFSFFLLPQAEEPLSLEKVAGNIYCLYGGGGNIGLLTTEEGILMVDAKFARLADQVLAKINELGARKIVYLVNTHYHGDHMNGNSILGKDARIMCHKNCLASFTAGLKPEEKAETVGIPQRTFEREMALKFGDEVVRLLHLGPGHTSGDAVVVFEKSKVIHAGDLFFNGMPPYIDVKDGADTQNWILAIEHLNARYPDFEVIPGHGKAASMQEFLRFADYLRYLRREVEAAIKAGKTRQQAQETIDLSPFSHIKDTGQFLTKKENIGWVYDEMTKKQ